MEKNGLLVIIFNAVCGLVCIGLGVYYTTCGKGANGAVCLVVGAVCLVIAVRTLINMRKQKKDKDKDENSDNSK